VAIITEIAFRYQWLAAAAGQMARPGGMCCYKLPRGGGEVEGMWRIMHYSDLAVCFQLIGKESSGKSIGDCSWIHNCTFS